MPIPKKQETIVKQTAKERVYCMMRDWIIDGTLKPNEKLFDSEIAEYFSVSRTPVREAFQMLEAQNLIQVVPGKETSVTEIKLENIKEWYLPLISLHCLAVEIAYPKITPAHIAQLENINHELYEATDAHDIKRILQEDKAFHDCILKVAGNPYILDFSDVLNIHIQRAETIFFKHTKTVRKSTQDHQKIIDALKNQDMHVAIETMRKNWLNTVEQIESMLRDKIKY